MTQIAPQFFSHLKFIYSEKATKFYEISTVDLSYVVPVKFTGEISQNFVAFSEYTNFNTRNSDTCTLEVYYHISKVPKDFAQKASNHYWPILFLSQADTMIIKALALDKTLSNFK